MYYFSIREDIVAEMYFAGLDSSLNEWIFCPQNISSVHCTDILSLLVCLGHQRDSVTEYYTFKHLKPNTTTKQKSNILGNACLPANPQPHEKINTNLISLRSGFGMCLVKLSTKTWSRETASMVLSKVKQITFEQLQSCLIYALHLVYGCN